MPFMGKDWRSPGEAWVKTEELGWQRMKIIESQLRPPNCAQNPACSWPPKSELGQHMANNLRDPDHGRLSRAYNVSNHGRGSVSSQDDRSSDSGSGSESVSTSPTGSPEKCQVHLNPNHLHPIVISSSYGQYACCKHHRCAIPCQKILSRSLSPDIPRKMTPSPVNQMRYNRSVPNFRDDDSSSSGNYCSSDSQFSAPTTRASQPSQVENNKSTPRLSPLSTRIESETRRISRGVDRLDHSEDVISTDSCAACCSCSSTNQENSSPESKDLSCLNTAPHCRISVRTREVAMYNTISEAFYRLDFCNAIHDIRRFNYICKLLHLLITQNLTSLSGCATRVLFNLLEQVAWEVSSNKRNIHVLRNLLDELRQTIQKYYCWGRPIGSTSLWQQHFDTIERISRIVDRIELSPPNDGEARITFDNLPTEMIREILLRLNDYRDLVNSAQASPVMRSMIDGQYIWKRLCRYHFTDQQLKATFNTRDMPLVRRGIKYARTTTADGKSSFRHPIEPKFKKSGTSAISKTHLSRLQAEQTGGVKDLRSSFSSKTGSAIQPTGIVSHVSETIKRFDGSDTNQVITRDKARDTSPTAQRQAALRTSRVDACEIDWEHVFHQLRKKYDLKEEYADCLLLCRHCRCLFWKSFGHPCIKNEDDERHHGRQLGQDSGKQQPSSSGDTDQQLPTTVRNSNRMDSSADRSCRDRGDRLVGEAVRSETNGPSVAQLSRDFDSRARIVPQSSREASRRSLPPPSAPEGLSSREAANAFAQLRQRRSSNDHRNRVPLQELGARLGNGRPVNHRADGLRNRDDNNTGRRHCSSRRGEELVPKHVIISPQEFLKFFSL